MSKVSLYASRCANYDRATERTLSTLQVVHYIKTIAPVVPHGAKSGFVIVQAPFDLDKWYRNKWFTLCDNGGEVQVSLINGDSGDNWVDTGVPFTNCYGRTITAETMAYRIAATIRGDAIDWEFEAPGLGAWIPALGEAPLALLPKALERLGAY